MMKYSRQRRREGHADLGLDLELEGFVVGELDEEELVPHGVGIVGGSRTVMVLTAGNPTQIRYPSNAITECKRQANWEGRAIAY